jgi:hypothetical protein
LEQETLLEGDHVKREPITPGTLHAIRDPWDEWNTSHQRERPLGFVVKTYTHERDPIHPHSYHILFSNGAYELEMEGYVRNVYKVVG